MLLGVPLFGEEVAPRFCSSNEFLFVELTRGGTATRHRQLLPQEDWPIRLQRLAQLGVGVLLCSGFNRRFLPRAEGLGIQVIWGLAGTADELVEAFQRGTIEQHRLCPKGLGAQGPPGCRGRGRGPRAAPGLAQRGGRRHRQRRRGV